MLIIFLIALGLSMDAFAVSVATGTTLKEARLAQALKLGISFGIFQAIMPVFGWYAGLSLKDIISQFDHWVAFGILSAIGVKMIYESLKLKTIEKHSSGLTLYILLMLSLATSIDALAVGLTFAFLDVSIVTSVIIIGCVTFFLSFLGVYIGNTLGHFFETKIEFLGGLILIGIGVRILLAHLR